jgi:hypothetical protein
MGITYGPLTEAEAFFYEHAGWSYHPVTETPEEGRICCARELAEAERRLAEAPDIEVVWDDDVYGEPSDGYNGPVFVCTLYRVDDCHGRDVLASLCGIECEDGAPYMRVIEAELMDEYLGSPEYLLTHP